MLSLSLVSTQLSFFLFCCFSCFFNINYAAKEADGAALLAFKASITSDPLGVLSSWNSSIHFCQWHGVECSNQRRPRVTVLDLHSQQLAGSLPPHIGNLSFLQVLNLTQNNFISSIPPQIGNLLRLKILNLGTNSFEGQVPGNISKCSNLIYLGLYSNSLTGPIPPELGSLQQLQRLVVHNNSLSGPIPLSFGNLSSIQVLSAALNSLEGSIPSTLGQLKSLSFLGLGANNLSGTIPASIYNLTSITLFSIPVNRIHGTLPTDLGLHKFPKLETLNIHTNHFSGRIPRSIANATTLREIKIQINQFIGEVPSFASLRNLEVLTLGQNSFGRGEDSDLNFLPSLANCTNLQILNIDDCNFGGTLPPSFSNFSTNLQKITVAENHIHGTIPLALGNLVNLDALGMEMNQLSGAIPNSLGKLNKLGELYLGDNMLSGQIPSSLGNLTSLMSLSLVANNLEGPIPSSLGQYMYLERMRLSDNKLSGTIPEEVLSLSTLSLLLDLSHNHLTGSLPSAVGQLKMLSILDVSGNKLSGPIPNTLSSCTSLTSLNLNNNLFNGTIPQSLSSLRGLDHLDLSRNNLSGKFPVFFKTFVLLNNLNLSYNDFDGEVPADGVFSKATVVSVFGNKRLCGGVPQLQLPICNANKSKKQKVSVALKISISVIGGLVVLILAASFSYFMLKKRKQTSSSTFLIDDLVMRLSFESLFKATNGFSSNNLIGKGSFGSVYKGVLEENEQVIAVKVLDLQFRGASRSFVAECQALRGIRHRNLVKILTACSSIDFQRNDFKALVFEYMPNGSLEEWLHPVSIADGGAEGAKNLSFYKRVDIAIDVACALNYLHHCCHTPIVHCDIKPSNVLLDGDMTACVGDFGLARFLSQGTQASSANESSTLGLKGSIGYIAPEYGMGSEVSTYGDVYSYGILVLEMFTGKRPTDSMFEDGLDIRQFVVSALASHEVTQFVDPILNVGGENANTKNYPTASKQTSLDVEECLISVLGIGIACSAKSPSERSDIRNVVAQLNHSREVLLGTNNEVNKC